MAAFRQTLRGLGWTEGRNLTIDNHYTVGEAARTQALARELIEIRGHEMIIDLLKTFKPKRRNLIQHRAFERNRIGQNYIESGKTIADDEEQSVAEVEDFAHFAAAQFFYSCEID